MHRRNWYPMVQCRQGWVSAMALCCIRPVLPQAVLLQPMEAWSEWEARSNLGNDAKEGRIMLGDLYTGLALHFWGRLAFGRHKLTGSALVRSGEDFPGRVVAGGDSCKRLVTVGSGCWSPGVGGRRARSALRRLRAVSLRGQGLDLFGRAPHPVPLHEKLHASSSQAC